MIQTRNNLKSLWILMLGTFAFVEIPCANAVSPAEAFEGCVSSQVYDDQDFTFKWSALTFSGKRKKPVVLTDSSGGESTIYPHTPPTSQGDVGTCWAHAILRTVAPTEEVSTEHFVLSVWARKILQAPGATSVFKFGKGGSPALYEGDHIDDPSVATVMGRGLVLKKDFKPPKDLLKNASAEATQAYFSGLPAETVRAFRVGALFEDLGFDNPLMINENRASTFKIIYEQIRTIKREVTAIIGDQRRNIFSNNPRDSLFWVKSISESQMDQVVAIMGREYPELGNYFKSLKDRRSGIYNLFEAINKLLADPEARATYQTIEARPHEELPMPPSYDVVAAKGRATQVLNRYINQFTSPSAASRALQPNFKVTSVGEYKSARPTTTMQIQSKPPLFQYPKQEAAPSINVLPTIETALREGKGVVIAFNIADSEVSTRANKGAIRPRVLDGTPRDYGGSHAMQVVGVRRNPPVSGPITHLIVNNSWGWDGPLKKMHTVEGHEIKTQVIGTTPETFIPIELIDNRTNGFYIFEGTVNQPH